jgi:hypothetical protein
VKQNEQIASLRAELRVVAVEELGWDSASAEQLVDAAIRRWFSFERRNKPNKRTIDLRIQDLVQGLRQSSPVDVFYLEPGDFERLAPRFAELLGRHTP